MYRNSYRRPRLKGYRQAVYKPLNFVYKSLRKTSQSLQQLFSHGKFIIVKSRHFVIDDVPFLHEGKATCFHNVDKHKCQFHHSLTSAQPNLRYIVIYVNNKKYSKLNEYVILCLSFNNYFILILKSNFQCVFFLITGKTVTK